MVCPASDPPGVNEEPGVRDLDVPRRAFAVASAQNAASEDLFVKSKRSFDVGDGEKVCDGKPILRRHLIAFCSTWTWFIDDSNPIWYFSVRQNTTCSVL